MQNAIIRLIVLAIVLVNQALVVFGFNPLPFTEDQIYEAVSSAAVVAMSLYAWWTNNSVTKEAQKADQYLSELKAKKK